MQKLLKSMLIFLILAWTSFPVLVRSVEAAMDTKQHWAEPIIDQWTNEGMIEGYEDGTFRPDHSITRAEIAALINRKFKLTSTRIGVSFPDLANNKWQFEPLATAAEVGYIRGYEDGTIRPNEAVTRQEVAVIIANLFRLETKEAVSFIDGDGFPEWSKKEISAVVANGIMDGYSDLTFAPTRAVTRAEAIVVLDRSNQVKQQMGPLVFSSAGVFGPESGNETWNRDVAVNVQGVTLRNMTIYGNLLLGEGIGEGDVTLQNVIVRGTTTVKGGGPNSIHFEDSTMATIVIEKVNGEVRIVAKGATSVLEVEVHSAVKIEEDNINGAGFTRVVLPADLAEGTEVKFIGDFQEIQVKSKNAKVQIIQGTVNQMYVTEGATGNVIHLGKQAVVKDLILNASIIVSGQGTIEKATVSDAAAASTFEKKPSTLNGQTTTAFGGGGGGGGGTVTLPQTQPDNLTLQAAVIGYNKLGITFSKSVATSTMGITLKNSNIEVERVEYSSDGRNATLILKSPLSEGSYTIVVQQKLTNSVHTVEQDIMVEKERLTFSYLHDSVIWNASSPTIVKVKYKLMNQYGEDAAVRYSSELKFSFYPDVKTSEHTAADNGMGTLQYNRPLNEKEKLWIYAFLGTANLLKKEMIVSKDEMPLTSSGIAFITPSFEVSGLHHPANKKLTVSSIFQEFSILFRWSGDSSLISENFYTIVSHPDVLNIKSNVKGPEFGTLTMGNESWSSLILTRGNSPSPKDVTVYLIDKSSGTAMQFVVTVYPIATSTPIAEATFVVGNQLIAKYAATGNFANTSWTLNDSITQAVYQAQYAYSQQDIAVFTIQGDAVPSGLYTATPSGNPTVYKTITVGTTAVKEAVYGKIYYNGASEVRAVVNTTYLDPNAPYPVGALAVNDKIQVFYGNELLLKANWNGVSWSFTEMKPITAPSNVSAVAKSNRQIRVNWSPVENADYYKIYTSSTETGEYVPLLDAQGKVIKTKETTVLDENLGSNTKRFYTIKAAFGGGNWEVESKTSAAIAATTYYNEHIQLDFLAADSVQHPTEPIVYLTDKENLKLHAVNYKTGSVNSVSLPLPPESVTFADGKIYVSLLKGEHSSYVDITKQSGAVAIVNSNDLLLSKTFDVNIDPYDIAVDRSGYIYIASGSGQWTKMKAYSPTVFSEVYSTSIREASYIHMHPTFNRIYTITTDTSPRDITAYNIQDGAPVSTYDSPYHGDYAMNVQMRISPDGKYLFNGAGTVFQAKEARSSDMKYVYRLNTGFTDITFDINENHFYTAKDKIIGAYQYDNFEQLGKHPIDGNATSLYSNSDKLLAISTIGSRSVVEIVYKNNMQIIPPIVRQGIYLHGKISNIVSAPDGKKAYALDEAFHKLYVVDLVNNAIEQTISLAYKPSELTLSEDGNKLYIRNNDENVLVTEISLSNFQIQRHLSYQAPLDDSDPAHGQIYQRGQFLYVVTGEWSPRLVVFNASTFQKVNYGTELASIGAAAFTKDNSKLYYWFQYGWGAGLAGSDVYEISIANTPFTQTNRTNIGYPDFQRDPLDAPVLLLEDRGLVVVKDRILNKNLLNQTIAVLPEPIYAVSPDGKIFAGKNGLYDAQSYQKLQSLALSGARDLFFANDKLYYLDGSSLKQLEYR
jgi:hypothetical protein